MGTKLELSTTFHPQIDGQFVLTIQVLEDMLQTFVMEIGSHWDQFLPPEEFAYNNTYYSSIQMALFEAFYRRRCRYVIGLFD